jgi:hypothetical protein
MTWLGTALTVVGLIYTLRPANTSFSAWQIILSTLAVICVLVLITWDVVAYWKARPQTFDSDQNKINNYMYRWISNSGRVAIFTRDMTWAQHDDRIRKLLLSKAQRRELTICLPESIPLTDELKDEGASIFTYAGLGHVPESRFTIVNYGRADQRVAVGRDVRGQHVIEEFSAGEHPVFSVADDLVQIIEHYASL